jgi:aryl-alcohol dehydrogenase-like predicted oxidoreductase
MRQRALGKTGLLVSEIGFGAWGAGGTQWLGVSTEDREDAMLRALDLGINFFDTAAAYGDGCSERMIGKVLKERSAAVTVATKVAPLNRIWPAPIEARIDDVFPRSHIMRSTEESLRNLGVECIDLQQLHV